MEGGGDCGRRDGGEEDAPVRVCIAGESGVVGEGQITLEGDDGRAPADLRVEIAGERGHVGEGVVSLEEESNSDDSEKGLEMESTPDFDVEQGHTQTETHKTARSRSTRTNAKACLTSHFLYFYLRSLFPTHKELDYRWEWNPWTYAKKLAALEETGKNRSKHKQNYPLPLIVIFYAWVGSFVGIAVVAIITQYGFSHLDKPLLIGSFGATAVLIYGAQQSPLAQPKNVLGGHGIAALVGVTCYKAMGSEWYSCALAVSLAITFMLLTTTPHPPAGATALLAVTGGDTVYDAGYYYVPTTLFGVSIMLGVALLWNNLPRAPHMKYPRYWL